MSKTMDESNLFREELQTLQTAELIAADAIHRDDRLLESFQVLISQYDKLLKLTKKTFRISDNQGKILHQHQSEIQNLLDNANQGFLTFGADLNVGRQYSAECLKIFGRKVGGVSILELLSEQDGKREELWKEGFQQAFSVPAKQADAILKQLPSLVRLGVLDVRIEYKLIHRGARGEEDPLIMLVLTDITDKLKAEVEIHYLSYHDKLTGLFNRAYVEKAVAELNQSADSWLSVVVIDMNGLKITNDVFGHEQGDKLLIALAQVLKAACRQTDVVARWGGDEFLVLLPGADNKICAAVCERIVSLCRKVDSQPIRLSAALGSATRQGPTNGLSDLFSIAENSMYSNKLAKSREVRSGILSEMENQLNERCYIPDGHNLRVRELAHRFAAFCGLGPDRNEMKPLAQLAALHDIGKVTINCEILGKPGPLTPVEWQVVRRHSEIGYRLAQSIGNPTLAEVILAVHERWDGTGYPNGLSGAQIPLLARLFAIADVYDVLTHSRPYGPPMDPESALVEIASGAATQFDPELVGQFLEFAKTWPWAEQG